MNKLVEYSLVLFTTIATGYLIIIGKGFLIPFIVALSIWFLIDMISDTILKYKTLPYGISLFFSLIVFMFFSWMLIVIVTNNINEIIQTAPTYQQRFQGLFDQFFSYFAKIQLPNFSDKFDYVSMITNFAQGITEIAGSAGMILVYLIFIFSEQLSYPEKLKSLIPDEKQRAKTNALIQKIKSQTQSYLRIKTFLSLLTSIISYTILMSVGVDFAQFWALLIFLLNYIPTIGSIIATVFPCLLTIVQFDSFTPFFIVTITLTMTQFVIGNILEPKLMGHSFNLSGLVIIISLIICAQIWGIVGMFLSVPIMMIMKIIFTNFPKTRPLAILLSKNGKL